MILKIKKLHEDAIIPQYITPGSVGFDFHSIENIKIKPGQFYPVRLGLAVEIPTGYELQVRQRSGLSLQYYNYLTTCIGTVDSDFRGELKALIYNHNKKIPFIIHKGDRIAQGIISPIIQCEFEVVDKLSKTERGTGGFGHSGK